jgi:glycosyltransferase involved in cell wall biosynthesis
MTPRISVIMHAYNADATMAASVASVLGQTYGDFELIIVDDGSRDGSAGMARLLAIEDRRIRTLRQPHGGGAAARNRGLTAAAGEYLTFLTAAEIWAPSRLARHLAFMDKAPECGVTIEPDWASANLFVHRAVFAEAGPFNTDLPDGDEVEWIARVQDLTDWQIHNLGNVAPPFMPPVGHGPAASAHGRPAPSRPAARRFGGMAAFLVGALDRRILAH